MLVEDDEDDIFLFNKALSSAGIRNPVRHVTNGHDALDFLVNSNKDVDSAKWPTPFILFLDLKMPHMDGFEVLAWIRQQPWLQSLVVVVLSGSGEAQDQKRAYALGARSYLVKPLRRDDIRQFMLSMGSLWASGEEGPLSIENGCTGS